MHTYAMLSGGPGSGVYTSHDGGDTWKKIEGHGMPKSPVGKIDVAIAPSNAKRVYALIQTADQGSVWRSDDGGENWAVVNWQRALIGRAGYYIRLAVNPTNPDEVFVADSSFWGSTDGGKSFRDAQLGRRHARYLDRSQEPQPHPGDPRWRHVHDHRPRADVQPRDAADRPDVSRRGGQRRAVQDLRQHAGRRHHARPEQRAWKPAPTCRGRAAAAAAGLAADAAAAAHVGAQPGRLRERLHHSRSHRQQHRVGFLLRQRSHALRRARRRWRAR